MPTKLLETIVRQKQDFTKWVSGDKSLSSEFRRVRASMFDVLSGNLAGSWLVKDEFNEPGRDLQRSGVWRKMAVTKGSSCEQHILRYQRDGRTEAVPTDG